MATGTEKITSDNLELHSPKIGNTNNDAILGGSAHKYRVFECVLNPEVLKFYNEIKQYILHFESLEYLLTVEHFNQKRQHYHILIKFKTPIKLNPDKMYHCHFSVSRKGFKNIYNYITCQDKKHKSKGVYFKIIDEINKTNTNYNTKKYEKKEVKKVEDDWSKFYEMYPDNDDTEKTIKFIINNKDYIKNTYYPYYKNKTNIYNILTYTTYNYDKFIRMDFNTREAWVMIWDKKQKKITSYERLNDIENALLSI